MAAASETLDESILRLQSEVEQLVVPRHCSGTFPLSAGKAGLFFRNDNATNAK